MPAPPAPSQQWLPGGLRVGVFLPHPGWSGGGSGNIFPGEKAGGQASSSRATSVQLQPCWDTRGWTGALLWRGGPQGGTCLAEWLPAQANALLVWRHDLTTLPRSSEHSGLERARPNELRLPSAACTHPAPPAGYWVSPPPPTGSPQDPKQPASPSYLHITSLPSRPSVQWALSSSPAPRR